MIEIGDERRGQKGAVRRRAWTECMTLALSVTAVHINHCHQLTMLAMHMPSLGLFAPCIAWELLP
jgi:hypothetical protein